jgi:hypothetical protein
MGLISFLRGITPTQSKSNKSSKVDSWTVEWSFRATGLAGSVETRKRVAIFTDYKEAKMFKMKLTRCGRIIGCWLNVELRFNK